MSVFAQLVFPFDTHIDTKLLRILAFHNVTQLIVHDTINHISTTANWVDMVIHISDFCHYYTSAISVNLWK